MTAETIKIVTAFLWGIAAAGFAIYSITITSQALYVTLADGRKQIRNLPFLLRLFLPLTPNITPFLKINALKPFFAVITRRIIVAGYDGLLTAENLTALRLILPLILGPFWILLIFYFSSITNSIIIKKTIGILYLIGPVYLFIYPAAWLQRTVTERHKLIQKALPFFLDLMTLSIEAGMDFMSALQKYVEKSKIDPLSEELMFVIREIQLGKTRRNALRELAARVDLPDLKSVINAMVQADELGVSIGSILRIQADQIRMKRFARAEKLAHEAPVKMLAPLLLFIFPATFLILLGPVILRLIRQGI